MTPTMDFERTSIDGTLRSDDTSSDADSKSTGIHPSSASAVRTYNAIRKSFMELDGILHELNHEGSHATGGAEGDEDGDDSSDDGEHGVQELRAELDAVYLPPWKKYFAKATTATTIPRKETSMSKMVSIKHRSSHSSLSLEDVRHQGEDETIQKSSRRGCSKTIGTSLGQKSMNHQESDDTNDVPLDHPPSAEQSNADHEKDDNNTSTVSFDSTQNPVSYGDSRGFYAVPVQMKHRPTNHKLPIFYTSFRTCFSKFLQLIGAVVCLGFLVGVAAIFFRTDDTPSQPVIAASEKSHSNTAPAIERTPTTEKLNGTEDSPRLQSPPLIPTLQPSENSQSNMPPSLGFAATLEPSAEHLNGTEDFLGLRIPTLIPTLQPSHYPTPESSQSNMTGSAATLAPSAEYVNATEDYLGLGMPTLMPTLHPSRAPPHIPDTTTHPTIAPTAKDTYTPRRIPSESTPTQWPTVVPTAASSRSPSGGGGKKAPKKNTRRLLEINRW